jgi:UDP:flavonoid glycosyltransferase YjiC (YdhE family)
MLADKKMQTKLKKTSLAMRAKPGPTKAASVIDRLTRRKIP